MPETLELRATDEYQLQAAHHYCKTCGHTIDGRYYRIESAMTCPPCAEKIGGQLPTSPRGSFSRGLLFATGSAIVGLILYAAVGILTGLEIGIVSIAVGYLVGRGMLMGSAGVGGRRHQIAAAFLTYMAVSMSSVPISLWHFSHEEAVASAAVEGDGTASDAIEGEESPGMAGGLVRAIVFFGVIGLASPLLGLTYPLSGVIGLVILVVGIRIAWRMTAGSGVEVTGPYHC